MFGSFTPRFRGRYVGTVPVGALIYWAKSFNGVPSLVNQGIDWFQECNGQVCTDGRSRLSGQTLPAINTQSRFLRGQATSGGTGGSDGVHLHTISAISTQVLASIGGTGFAAATLNPSTDTTDARPAFYNAVCLICTL